MRKITLFFAVIITLSVVLFAATPIFAEEDIRIYISGTELKSEQSAAVVEGRTLVPLRAICEALGCKVSWNESTKSANIMSPTIILAVQLANETMAKRVIEDSENVKSIKLDVAPQLINGSTYVPVRAIAEGLDAAVIWGEKTKTITIIPQFDEIGEFDANGFSKISKYEKFGLINKKTEVVVPVKYDDISNFNGKFSIAKSDTTSMLLIAIQDGVIKEVNLNRENEAFTYKVVRADEDYAIVESSKGLQGVIDSEGNKLVDFLHYKEITYYNGKIGIAKQSSGAKMCVINPEGEKFPNFTKTYGRIENFDGKFANAINGSVVSVLAIGEGENGIKISELADSKFSYEIVEVVDDFAIIKRSDKMMGVINRNGETVIEFVYDSIVKGAEKGEFKLTKTNVENQVINLNR